jgi:hypothetical protein
MPLPSLGAIPLPEQTVAHDFSLLERYQEFSAELLRVSLVAISAIGYAASRILFPDDPAQAARLDSDVRLLLVAALLLLGISSAAALLHRYAAVNSMSWHLQALRRAARCQGNDAQIAATEFRKRLRHFRLSRWAIGISALALAAGALTLVLALVIALR